MMSLSPEPSVLLGEISRSAREPFKQNNELKKENEKLKMILNDFERRLSELENRR